MNENEISDSDTATESERRLSPHLRSRFADVFTMIAPFFDPAQEWGGHSLEHLAFHVVRDNFPDLDSDEVHALVVAAHRVYIERNPRSSKHLPRPGERPQTKP